jgi:hypothetical protein
MVVTGCTLEDAWRQDGGWGGESIRDCASAPQCEEAPDEACLLEASSGALAPPPPASASTATALPTWFAWAMLLLLLLVLVLLVHLAHAHAVHTQMLRDVLWALSAQGSRRW